MKHKDFYLATKDDNFAIDGYKLVARIENYIADSEYNIRIGNGGDERRREIEAWQLILNQICEGDFDKTEEEK